MYLLTANGCCVLCVFVSVHCVSHIPVENERWEVCGWSGLHIDLICESKFFTILAYVFQVGKSINRNSFINR